MKVLVACEFSGEVRDAFATYGHEAWSCDILPSEKEGNHYQGDVRDILYNKDWDLLIAHPPCTRLCNSGVRWIEERNLWNELADGVELFNTLYNAPIDRICIENPIPHKHATRYLEPYSQIIQPYQFGYIETKATCLWLKNLPLLKPTKVMAALYSRTHLISPSKNRSKERSRTYPNIAKVMAEQWGFLSKNSSLGY